MTQQQLLYVWVHGFVTMIAIMFLVALQPAMWAYMLGFLAWCVFTAPLVFLIEEQNQKKDTSWNLSK